jgi:hypothetical protein
VHGGRHREARRRAAINKTGTANGPTSNSTSNNSTRFLAIVFDNREVVPSDFNAGEAAVGVGAAAADVAGFDGPPPGSPELDSTEGSGPAATAGVEASGPVGPAASTGAMTELDFCAATNPAALAV